jgi:hypothetical protein
MIAFHKAIPKIGTGETRSIILPEGKMDIPPGEYGFLEFYCDERGCDCQQVFISVIKRGGMSPVASISHSFNPPPPDAAIKAQTFLDPLHPNAPYAPRLMQTFLEIVLDEAYGQRLRRHYRMVKQSIEAAPKAIRASKARRKRRRK